MSSHREGNLESCYNRKVEIQARKGIRLAAAARFPKLKMALNSLPPTPAEIESIILNGLPEGFCDPPKTVVGSNRWGYRLGDNRRVKY